MTNAPQSTDRLWPADRCPFDAVIDVRSPGEFAEDHVPGAINLPVLSDAERAEVGTIYRHVSAFAARVVGASFVSANIAAHLRGHFADKPKDYRPLLYCWRGGHRSGSIAIVLAHVGWRVTVLSGGYKTYRKHVMNELETRPGSFTYRLLAGATGTGKTQLLAHLAERGAQVLDLEALAGHRGSVLGDTGAQPAQKLFESQLLAVFDRFTPTAPVWVEAESNRIGNVYLPPALWAAMRAAGGVDLRAPVAGRVRHLMACYPHLIADPPRLKARLRSLAGRHGPRQIEAWERWIDAGAWEELVASLLAVHYDPGYAASTLRCFPNVTDAVELDDVTDATLRELAAWLTESPGAK